MDECTESSASLSATRTRALVTAAQCGESGAIDELIAEHLSDVRAFVRLQLDPLVRVRESCSDVVQSVCREVLEDLPRFEYRGAGSFRAWLFTAAMNKVRQKGNFHRAQKRDVAREVHVDAVGQSEASEPSRLYANLCALEPSPSEQAVGNEQAARLERAVDALPPDYREALLLSRFVGLHRREIAERMGRSEKSVRHLLTRAGVRLLAALEERS